jgi:hypothetical protein
VVSILPDLRRLYLQRGFSVIFGETAAHYIGCVDSPFKIELILQAL